MWLLWPWYIYTPFMTLRQITKSLKSYSQYKLHQLLQLWQATQDTKARQLVEYAGLKSGETNMGTSLLLAPCPWVSFLPPHWTPLSFSQHYNSQQLISGKKKQQRENSKPWTHYCKMLYTELPPCTPIYPFHSHAYELLLLTQSANWSEPPLHRAHWPPTPTLRTVAGCQVGKSVRVCVLACVCV